MAQLRNTRQRRLVLDAVRARCDHPSAEDICADVRAADAHISRGTVYRNLNILARGGDILHVKVPGVDRFDRRTQLHYHLLCTGCGKLTDVPAPYDASLDEALAAGTGYRVARHRMLFEGLCPDCQAARRPDEK
ncbi:MAG: transcriptional repressor [Oscillospiraceae bacterium]|nr:transcriptional repressor [Oscillospiraceae bacterium]